MSPKRASDPIEERQRWRDDQRELTSKFLATEDAEQALYLYGQIVLRLNANGEKELLKKLRGLLENPNLEDKLDALEAVQELLKRDWERAKIETRFFSYRASCRAGFIVSEQNAKDGWSWWHFMGVRISCFSRILSPGFRHNHGTKSEAAKPAAS